MSRTMPKKSTKSLLRNEQGSVAIWLAGSLAMLMGVGALVVDVGNLYALDNRLQTAADAAALAAASQLPDADNVRSVATAITAQNLPPEIHGTALVSSDVELGQWDSGTKVFAAGVNPLNAVRVTVRRTSASGNAAPTFFAKVLGKDSVDIVAQAVYASGRATGCLVALDPDASEAIKINSNATITANGCAVQVNSSDEKAVIVDGSSDLTAEATYINGDYDGPESSYTPQPTTGAPTVSDPLAGLPPPPEADDPCDETSRTYDAGVTVTITPGVYCESLEISDDSTATLQAGTYIFRDGDLIVNSNSAITGDGVFMYFTGTNKPSLVLNANSHADLSAPTTGPYAGILIFQDRNVEDGSEHMFNSDASSSFLGTIYVPNGMIKINSGTTMSSTAPYTSIIARTFDIDSGSDLVLNSDYEATDVPLPAGLAGSNGGLVY